MHLLHVIGFARVSNLPRILHPNPNSVQAPDDQSLNSTEMSLVENDVIHPWYFIIDPVFEIRSHIE